MIRLRALLVDDWRVPFAVISVLLGVVMLGAVFFFVSLKNTTDGLCDLNAARIHDKERQIGQTREYLDTPLGMERNGLNDFIRRNSLPRLARELGFERDQFPEGCSLTKENQ